MEFPEMKPIPYTGKTLYVPCFLFGHHIIIYDEDNDECVNLYKRGLLFETWEEADECNEKLKNEIGRNSL